MDEKTEKPTAKRLRDAKKKGQVLKSREVTDTASYFVLLAVMLAIVPWLWKRFERLFELAWSRTTLQAGNMFWSNVLADIGRELILLIFPMALVVAASTAIATFLQVRGVFTTEPIKPDINKLNPVEGFKRIFSTMNLFNFFKRLLALGIIGATASWIVMDGANAIMHLMYVPPVEAARSGARVMLLLFFIVGLMFAAFAALDFGHQYYEFMKRMRMSKDDVRREHKDMEGDPHIRGERRRLMRDLATNAPGDATRKASVLVVNPTHYAVAVLYKPGLTELPMVIEKAVEGQALLLRSVAREAGVPIFEYPLLARELFAKTEVFEYVPRELFPAVSEVLRWVRGLNPTT